MKALRGSNPVSVSCECMGSVFGLRITNIRLQSGCFVWLEPSALLEKPLLRDVGFDVEKRPEGM